MERPLGRGRGVGAEVGSPPPPSPPQGEREATCGKISRICMECYRDVHLKAVAKYLPVVSNLVLYGTIAVLVVFQYVAVYCIQCM